MIQYAIWNFEKRLKQMELFQTISSVDLALEYNIDIKNRGYNGKNYLKCI